MIALVITASSLLYGSGWVWVARKLYQRWRAIQQKKDAHCDKWHCDYCESLSNGFLVDLFQSSTLFSDPAVAATALIFALPWPLYVLPLLIMAKPPKTDVELEAERKAFQRRTEELEKQNAELDKTIKKLRS